MSEAEATKLDIKEIERTAAQQAKDKANTEAWNFDIAIFLFAILIINIILMFEGIRMEVSASVAVFGLGMGWIVGWRQRRRLYKDYYDEVLAKSGVVLEEPEEETVEELADVLEVIEAICNFKEIDKKELLELKRQKAEKRGKFKEKIILDKTE